MPLALCRLSPRARTGGRLFAIGRLALQAEKHERATLQVEDLAAAPHQLRGARRRLARVEQELPSEARPVCRQDEWERLVMGVQEDQQRVADDAIAALVELFDRVAGKPEAEAARFGVIPIVFGHLLAVEAKPGEVLDFRA